MPELPEVETIKRELAIALAGKVIESVKIFWPKSIAPFTPATFNRRLKGEEIESIERRAKILFFNLSNGETLAVHLKLTGQLIYVPRRAHSLQLPPRGRDKQTKNSLSFGEGQGGVHTRAIFNFADGSRLYFNDLRKFGWLRLLAPEHKRALITKHGLEPLSPEFTFKNFATQLKRYPHHRLKQTLLDQTLVAGLGNIYSDESCFAARVRPTRRSRALTVLEIKKLHQVIKQILKLAIKKGGTSAKDYVRSDGRPGGFVPHLKVYGRGKLPCKICQTPIAKIKLAGRGAHFCPKCQK